MQMMQSIMLENGMETRKENVPIEKEILSIML